MRNELSPFRFAVCTVFFLGLFTLQAYAQEKDHAQDADHPKGIVQDWSRHHVVYPRFGPIQSLISLQHDPRAILSWQAAEREDWHRAKDRDSDKDGDKGHGRSHGKKSGLQRDWSISLGNGTTAPAMYPAKYSFDVNAAPDCTNDFVVFPVNTIGGVPVQITGSVTNGSTTVTIPAGTITSSDVGGQISGDGIPANDTIASITGNPATSLTLATAATVTNTSDSLTLASTVQPNIVGFNNLYSGTAGSTGMCNAPANGRTSGTNDDGISATTIWSYNVSIGGGIVATSPALSLDGTKIAFVETGLNSPARFHVLAPHNGDFLGSNLQDVKEPIQITEPTTLAPTAGSGTASDLILTLGPSPLSDTFSSPFVVYDSDMAYVGNDSGTLFRIQDVFCTTQACITGGSPAPSLDLTWPATGVSLTPLSGTLQVCSGALTGPVVDLAGNVFVGCSDGKLYGFDSTGLALPGSGLIVGDGSATGGIVDPPLVDVVNGFVYVVSGNSPGGSSVLVQASATNLGSNVTATLGPGGLFKLHTPALNNAYFYTPFAPVSNVRGIVNPSVAPSTGITTSNWQLYEWADSGTSGSLSTLYGVGFDNNSRAMTSGPAANYVEIADSVNTEFSPVTEFLNGSTDQIFTGALEPSFPNTIVYNLTDFTGLFPNVFPPIDSSDASGATTGEGNGPSGIVVDNVSTAAQASSIYFGAQLSTGPPQIGNSAVKLTQSGLN